MALTPIHGEPLDDDRHAAAPTPGSTCAVGAEEGRDCGVGVPGEVGIRAACVVPEEHDLVHRDGLPQSSKTYSPGAM